MANMGIRFIKKKKKKAYECCRKLKPAQMFSLAWQQAMAQQAERCCTLLCPVSFCLLDGEEERDMTVCVCLILPSRYLMALFVQRALD